MMKGKKNMKLLRAMIHDKNKDIVNVNRIEFHYELETDIKIQNIFLHPRFVSPIIELHVCAFVEFKVVLVRKQVHKSRTKYMKYIRNYYKPGNWNQTYMCEHFESVVLYTGK